MKILLIVLATALVSIAKSPPTPDQTIKYKEVKGDDLHLHVFLPDGHQATDSRAAVVFFFGGGWSGGTPKQFYAQSRVLKEKGLIAFCAEYRVKSSHGTTPFECVQDGKSAVRWIREHAQEWGIDPNKIVSSGGSAGGHVAACSGVIKEYEAEGENLAISSVPNAIILFNPVLDTTIKGFGSNRFSKDQKQSLSPCHHVQADIPPTLIMTGTEDKTTPLENAERFTRLMKQAGNSCTLIPYDGMSHGFFNSPFFRPKIRSTANYDATLAETIKFLQDLEYL